MDVGENRHAHLALHPREDFQARLEAGTSKRCVAGAIGLVEGAFEDVGEAGLARDFRDAGGVAQARILALDDAGAGDQHQLRCAKNDIANFDLCNLTQETDRNSRTFGCFG